jgi:hypothetical protein
MSMTERPHIDADPADPNRPYTHLVPLVQALLDHGNRIAHPGPKGELFAPGQGGYVAYLTDRLDWDWLQATFELPDLLRYEPGDDEIYDHKNWVSILGSQPPG